MDQIQLGLSGLTGTILDQPSQTHTDLIGPKSIPFARGPNSFSLVFLTAALKLINEEIFELNWQM